ncbi:MBL fold metallo-hydrolase [Actinoallomurus purpureus]|uniref:MBL fold metallo-hydrolase n=1 Tax=Actinoallomurus purpureus TaxID=478114 RepID=UPI0027E2FAED|nr:MBL fold metallo-hydrolase [Actinoallomurus purpureus]
MTETPTFPSTIGGEFVAPSKDLILPVGAHIDQLFRRTMTEPFVLQRLSDRSYWVEVGVFATLFYVGEDSVLLMDPIEHCYDGVVAAIESVTPKPISTIVYTHFHADHIGDADRYVELARQDRRALRIVASEMTARKLEAVNSVLPRPTETVAWPKGSFTFEDLRVQMHGFEWAAHTDDHSAWLLATENIVHCPDLMGPDQPPFWRFTANERFLFAERNLNEVQEMEWDFLSAGHGNVGSRADVQFELGYYTDIRDAVTQAFKAHPITDFIDPSQGAHSAWFPSQLAAVAKDAVDLLRPKYGQYYGFEASAPSNAELAAFTVFAFR